MEVADEGQDPKVKRRPSGCEWRRWDGREEMSTGRAGALSVGLIVLLVGLFVNPAPSTFRRDAGLPPALFPLVAVRHDLKLKDVRRFCRLLNLDKQVHAEPLDPTLRVDDERDDGRAAVVLDVVLSRGLERAVSGRVRWVLDGEAVRREEIGDERKISSGVVARGGSTEVMGAERDCRVGERWTWKARTQTPVRRRSQASRLTGLTHLATALLGPQATPHLPVQTRSAPDPSRDTPPSDTFSASG